MTQNKHGAENSIVSLVRSPKDDASQISDEEVREMVREAVALAGGLADIIKDGQFVVIKPNLIGTRHVAGGTLQTVGMFVTNPYRTGEVQVPPKVNGMTADWRVARALVELVREVNPSGKVYVMECSGEGQVSKTFELLGYTKENLPGVDEFIGMDETGDDYQAVDSDDLEIVDLKEKQQYTKLPKFLNNKYYFDKIYYSADVVISLCCLKNHMNAAFTGGIKNVGIGAMPGRIYGNSKNQINRAMTIDHMWEPINDFIHDFYIAKPVQFVLTDGLQGLAYGPQAQGAPSYEEAKMNMRLILASKDPAAADAVHATIVGVDPQKVPYLQDVARDCDYTADTSRITVVGNARVDEVKKPFPRPKGLLGKIYSKPSEALYSDYEPPIFEVAEIKVDDDSLTVKVKVDPTITKIEMFTDGRLVESFTGDLETLTHPLDGPVSKGSHELALYAYDKVLNCSYKTITFEF